MHNNSEFSADRRFQQHYQRGNDVVEVHPMDAMSNYELGKQDMVVNNNNELFDYARAEDGHPHPYPRVQLQPALVNNSFLYHPVNFLPRCDGQRPDVIPMPRQNRQRGYPLSHLIRGGEEERRAMESMTTKQGLEKRRRLKERKKNSANIIDPTTIPGYFGDTDDMDKLIELVVGQPVADTQGGKSKKSGKKKNNRRKSHDVSPDAKLNGEDLDVEVALDTGDTGSEATLKDKETDSSEDGSPVSTRKSSKSSTDGKKKRKTSPSSVMVNGHSTGGSPNENGASVSKKDSSSSVATPKNGYVLQEHGQKGPVVNGTGVPHEVPAMVTKILTSAKNHSASNNSRKSSKRHREERPPEQPHMNVIFMSQIWNRFSEGCEDDKTYVPAQKRH